MNKFTNLKDSVFSDYKLKDFIIDSSNTEAYDLIHKWVESILSGKAAHIQIYGACGNGKTHLAAAAINHVIELNKSIVANCNNGQPISSLEIVSSRSLLLCEGFLSDLEKYSPELLRKCIELNISIIFTCDTKIKSISEIDSVEIHRPTDALLQNIVAANLREYPEISLTPLKEESVRVNIGQAKKEIMKKELGFAGH